MSLEKLNDAQDTKTFIVMRQSENSDRILETQQFMGTPNRNLNELNEILWEEILWRRDFKTEIKELNQERGEALRNKDRSRVNQLDIEISEKQEEVANLDENIRNLRNATKIERDGLNVLEKELQELEWEKTELESNLRNIDAKIERIIEQCDLNQETQNSGINSNELTIFVPSDLDIVDENEDTLLVVFESENNNNLGENLIDITSEIFVINIEEIDSSQIEIGVIDVTDSLNFDDLILSTNGFTSTENNQVLPNSATENLS